MTPELWDLLRIGIGFGIGFVVGFTVAATFVISSQCSREEEKRDNR